MVIACLVFLAFLLTTQIATALLLREDIRTEASNDAVIRVNRDDWAGTTDLPG